MKNPNTIEELLSLPKRPADSLILRIFTKIEIGIFICVGIFLFFVISVGMYVMFDIRAIYYDEEDRFKEEVIAPLAEEDKIDTWEAVEWLDERQAMSVRYWISCLMITLTIALGITESVMWVGLVYKKYRSLRYRERLEKYLFKKLMSGKLGLDK